ncbi:redoxin domain-containing protein [Salinimicrobium flavum]|uniref:Redoxin domain-containing protein n=1 Tax=Salinimicrobium flavum TaxID=1737065 RepID=A0ABW5J1X4_9FLAO
MRKILMLGVLAVFASCEEDKEEGYYLSGTVENATEGQKVVISELNDSNTQTIPMDTVTVVDGKFEVDLPEKDKPTISFLTMEGKRGSVLYIADNTPITFTLHPDSLHASTVTGGKDNEILYNYLGQIKETNRKMSETRSAMQNAFSTQDHEKLQSLQKDQEEISNTDKENKMKLVENNPGSIVSVMVLQDMINTQMYTSAELRKMFDQLSPEIKQTTLAGTLDQNLKKLSRTDIGSKAPEFSAPTPQGDELALKDVLGEVTLVDFWASWCKPCRVENPNIVEVYKKYHDKGFNIIQVSLDRPGQKEAWIKAIEDDKLGDWNHVSNLKFWQDPIAGDYGVRAIPAAFLLDKDGNIIGKDLRGKALGEKVSELLD